MKHHEVEQGNWFLTASGRKIFVNAPDPEDIRVEDIAHGLSNTCRFAGQCGPFYSVAQHSVLVSRELEKEVGGRYRGPYVALVGLLHDASEAYIGDITRPLKELLPDYRRIEKLWESAIQDKFMYQVDEDDALSAACKWIDRRALNTERRDVCHPMWSEIVWREDEDGVPPFDERILPMSPGRAREAFLERWAEIGWAS